MSAGKPHPGAARHQGGYTYFGLMLVLGVVAIGLGVGSSFLAQDLRREKEAELLFAGDQIRRAIENYHALNNGGQQPWPNSLEALLRDPNQPSMVRYLRRIYLDPMKPGAEWEPILGQGRGIIGVRSSSREKPIKRSGFAMQYRSFENARTYGDWRFLATGAVADPNAPGADAPGSPTTESAFPGSDAPAQPGNAFGSPGLLKPVAPSASNPLSPVSPKGNSPR